MTATARLVSFGTSGNQKFRSKPTEVDGLKFPSKKEAKRWQDLNLLQTNNLIRGLERQKSFELKVGNKLICRYIADFVYEEYAHGTWTRVVEDVKGYPTPVYRLKKKLMLACLGIDIRES